MTVRVTSCLLAFCLLVSAAFAQAPEVNRTDNGDIDDHYVKPDEQGVWGAILSSFNLGNFEKSYALVIGISEFENFTYLPTEKDPVRMRRYLIEDAGFDEVITLTGANVTKARIEYLMEETFPNAITSKDRFLFYWSGHGVTREIGDAEFGYLPLADSGARGWSGMIDMDDINRWDRFLVARQVLYLLDSCFSGLAGVLPQSSDPRDISEQQLMGPSRHLLTAGTGEQETIAIDYLGGSVFTAALIDGLKNGYADSANGRFDPDGLISVDELKVHVSQFVGFEANRAGWTNPITPQLRELRSNTGAFFFTTPEGKYGLRGDRPPPPPPPPGGGGDGPGPTPQGGGTFNREIADYQERLIELGLFNGDVDGQMSVVLEKAIGQFQGTANLPITGLPSEDTRIALLTAMLEAKETVEPPVIEEPDPNAPPFKFDFPGYFKDCADCPPMVRFQGGSKILGSENFGPEEGPKQSISIDPIAMAMTEVTHAQWLAFLNDTRGEGFATASEVTEDRTDDCYQWDYQSSPARMRRKDNVLRASAQTPYMPLSCVSHIEAQAYVDWLNDTTRGGYRLPVEAEMEFALRSQEWPSDPDAACELFNGALQAGAFPHDGGPCSGAASPAAVGTYDANPLGLYDLYGNLWELSHNCWTNRIDHVDSWSQDLPACSSGTVAVRGASFDDPVENFRPTIRQAVPNIRRQENIGFRVVKYP